MEDKDWGTAAFTNFRINLGGNFGGLISVSVDLKELAKRLGELKPGADGAVFMFDEPVLFALSKTRAW